MMAYKCVSGFLKKKEKREKDRETERHQTIYRHTGVLFGSFIITKLSSKSGVLEC